MFSHTPKNTQERKEGRRQQKKKKGEGKEKKWFFTLEFRAGGFKSNPVSKSNNHLGTFRNANYKV